MTSILKGLAPSVAQGLAGAGTAALVNKFFGPGDAVDVLNNVSQTGSNFTGGGLTGSRVGNTFSVTGSAPRDQLINQIGGTLNKESRAFANLRDQFGVGTSNIRKDLLNRIDNNQTKFIGDLRDSLHRRRIAGSSFAADTLARANREFNDQRSQVADQVGLLELQAQGQLINQQFTTAVQSFNNALQEMNLQGNTAVSLATSGQTVLANMAKVQANLLAQQAQGTGLLFTPAVRGAGQAAFDATRKLFT